jgi:hypothetical protein
MAVYLPVNSGLLSGAIFESGSPFSFAAVAHQVSPALSFALAEPFLDGARAPETHGAVRLTHSYVRGAPARSWRVG